MRQVVAADAESTALDVSAEGDIRLDANENPRGPGQRAIEALHRSISPRLGRGWPQDFVGDLVDAIAASHRVSPANVIIGAGSRTIVEAAVRAFCSPDASLVIAPPTYGVPELAARRIRAPIRVVPVDGSLGIDLDSMAAAATAAGLLFVCNPNNPTGTAHSMAAVDAFVRAVKTRAPGTRILVDEAYIDYACDPDVRSIVPLAYEIPGVVVTRSFSKAHGMAGLRLGYAIGHPATLRLISGAWSLGDVSTSSAAAGIASLNDPQHIRNECAENARARHFTLDAFRRLGYDAPDSFGNFIFANVRRPAAEFRRRCGELHVRVGRDFRPYEQTHARITIGTIAEMHQAVEVFRQVLAGGT